MLPIRQDTLYTPPSSPVSLSGSFIDSSSPPSSPDAGSVPLEHDFESDLPEIRVIDPFAGSYRSKRTASTSPLNISKKKPRHSYRQLPYPDDEFVAPVPINSLTDQDQDTSVWEEAVENAFTTGNRSIDLSSCHLTSIHPRSISDLNNVVVLHGESFDDSRLLLSAARPTEKRRAFKRIQTAPASSGFESVISRQRNASSSHVLSGASRERIDLYLGNNEIPKLPKELFTLQNLRILSLRNNQIKHLPPEIAKLENLVDLNIALNQLEFLPAEITRLKNLTTLIVLPNPFLPRPANSTDVSDTLKVSSAVPSLTEMALRVLLTPPMFLSTNQTLLEDEWDLPIFVGPTHRPISAPLRDILSTCVPGSVIPEHSISLPSKISREDRDQVTGIGRCPNPLHGRNSGVFVRQVEERFTWVDSIVGIRLGGLAPLRWRGCGRGCLDFLDPNPVIESEPALVEVEENIVHTVSFDARVLDFDD